MSIIFIIFWLSLAFWISFAADCEKLKYLPAGSTPLRCLKAQATTMKASVPENEINHCVKVLEDYKLNR